MSKRAETEQIEHDLVTEASASNFRKQGYIAYTNPRSIKNTEVNGLFPDVVAEKRDGSVVIEEIETESTVTEDECKNQWKPYSKLGYKFNIIVPPNKAVLAQRLIRRYELDITLQTYKIVGDSVSFYDSGGNHI